MMVLIAAADDTGVALEPGKTPQKTLLGPCEIVTCTVSEVRCASNQTSAVMFGGVAARTADWFTLSVGCWLGIIVGMNEGIADGTNVGCVVGVTDGVSEGRVEGTTVGTVVGESVGIQVGGAEGRSDGIWEGEVEDAAVGGIVGSSVGSNVGSWVGV